MTIRPATSDDVPEIMEILNTRYSESSDSRRMSGIFSYKPSEEFVSGIISGNDLCSVISTTKEIQGVLIAGNQEKIQELYEKKEDPFLRRILDFGHPFIYVDQLTTSKSRTFSAGRVIEGLTNKLFNQAKETGSRIICVIAGAPQINISSENFLNALNFDNLGKINKSGLNLNIYSKRPPK